MTFIPGLELARMLFEEQIQPLLSDRYPDLPYAAATLGMCSEVLGYDDEVSRDHEWGARVRLYLAEEDHARHADEVRAALREGLPLQFKGIEMMWRQPGVDLHDTREKALYHVSVGTASDALRFCGGLDALPLSDVDWLRVSEQRLLEFTAGVVYRDDVGELTRAREALAYYPDNVLRLLLMSEWYGVHGAWFPIGRMGTREDALGLRLQAAKMVQHLMRIAFMVSRRYFPYAKWFGAAFQELPVAGDLAPVLGELLDETDWRRLEERICQAAAVLAQRQNALGIAPHVSVKMQRVDDGRHHVGCPARAIGEALSSAVEPPLEELMRNQVFWMHDRNYILYGQEVGKWILLLQK